MRIKAKETFRINRIKKGFSITGLAKEMNVNSSVVFNIEKGKSTRPKTARKACEVLHQEFEELFYIEN